MRAEKSTRRRLATIATAGLLAVGAAAASVVAALPASAATICEQFGSVVAGNYIIQNNRWGSNATQCISTSSNGFTIIQQDGIGNLSGAPVSYPSIYLGCHYSNCSPNSPLPRQISALGTVNSSISLTYISSGTWNASYDIWLNADTNVSGVQDTEIMIWLNRMGSIQPIGSPTGTANIAGRSWTVWTGSNGQNNVVSYVSSSAINNFSFNVRDFIMDTLTRGPQYGNTSWYLTSVQAGFEPWIGGVGLAVNSFSVTLGGGTTTTSRPPTTTTSRPPTTTTSRPPTTTTSRPPQSGACSASYRLINSWPGGLQAEVTVTNNTSATINGWTVSLGLPGGVTIQNLWNGVNSGTSGNVTVRNAPYNGTIGPNGSTSFGYVASGSNTSAPSLSCTSP